MNKESILRHLTKAKEAIDICIDKSLDKGEIISNVDLETMSQRLGIYIDNLNEIDSFDTINDLMGEMNEDFGDEDYMDDWFNDDLNDDY
jgi:hypothetical protein